MSKKEKKKSKKNIVESPSKEEKTLATRPSTDISTGFNSLFDDFRKSFDDLMAPFMPTRFYWPETSTDFPVRAPLVDIIDKDNQYLIKAELPGFNKEMVDIQLNKDTLVLKAEKKLDKEETGENFVHRERSYSTCQRTINFPEEVDPESVDGKMVDGVLELKVKKKEPTPEEKMRKVQLK
jgi:HSP20 family protein